MPSGVSVLGYPGVSTVPLLLKFCHIWKATNNLNHLKREDTVFFVFLQRPCCSSSEVAFSVFQYTWTCASQRSCSSASGSQASTNSWQGTCARSLWPHRLNASATWKWPCWKTWFLPTLTSIWWPSICGGLLRGGSLLVSNESQT